MINCCRVNLDNFSVIAAGIGRSAGEFLLCSVAARLQELVTGERAMVARMGTDDVAILSMKVRGVISACSPPR
jgi:GGDEF domain-containing protein